MNDFIELNDPFLQSLAPQSLGAVEARREAWGLRAGTFYPLLGRWFANFEAQDKNLALKLLLKVDYYSDRRFQETIGQLHAPVHRFLAETGRKPEHLALVIPGDLADSADRHAYDVIKKWGLPQTQVQRADRLSLSEESVVVLFNDTHGTGNQFLRELWPAVKDARVGGVFVMAVAIGATALRRFRMELPGVHVLPDSPTPSVREQFTAVEYARLQEIGRRVYPRHPLGYGGAGLLTAYYFQCPNSSVPLLWADGKNNVVDGKSYPWNCLFGYIPKKHAVVAPRVLHPKRPVAAGKIKASNWRWTRSELGQIRKRITDWDLVSDQFLVNPIVANRRLDLDLQAALWS